MFHRWITFRNFTSGDEAAKWQEAFEREGIRYKLTAYNAQTRTMIGMPMNRRIPARQYLTPNTNERIQSESYTFEVHRKDFERASKIQLT